MSDRNSLLFLLEADKKGIPYAEREAFEYISSHVKLARKDKPYLFFCRLACIVENKNYINWKANRNRSKPADAIETNSGNYVKRLRTSIIMQTPN